MPGTVTDGRIGGSARAPAVADNQGPPAQALRRCRVESESDDPCLPWCKTWLTLMPVWIQSRYLFSTQAFAWPDDLRVPTPQPATGLSQRWFPFWYLHYPSEPDANPRAYFVRVERLPETEHGLQDVVGEQLLVAVPNVQHQWTAASQHTCSDGCDRRRATD